MPACSNSSLDCAGQNAVDDAECAAGMGLAELGAYNGVGMVVRRLLWGRRLSA